jgi:SAM-dependent methyltransferase
MNEFERLQASISRHGIWRTIEIGLMRFAAVISRAADRQFDLRRGTTTGRVVELHELDVVGENRDRGIRHQPSRARPLHKLLSQLPLPRNATFVDFGCGMGRALIIAAESGFEHIVGIDFSEALCEQARRNLAALPDTSGEHVTVVHADASEYPVQPDQNVFYFFNPFDAGLMATTVHNILASHRTHPRDIWIIYLNPLWHGVIDECPEIEKHSEHSYLDCCFFVYRITASQKS